MVLPLLRTSIASGLYLAFARSLGEVGITLMLGGNIAGRTNTISLEIDNAVFTGEYQRAMVLVLLLGAILPPAGDCEGGPPGAQGERWQRTRTRPMIRTYSSEPSPLWVGCFCPFFFLTLFF